MEASTDELAPLRPRSRKVLARIKQYWRTPQPFSSSSFSGIIGGIDMSNMMAQILVLRLLQQSVKAGDLPYWTTDAMIFSMGLLLALVAPFVSWLGYRRRRRTMLLWGLFGCLSLTLISFVTILPDYVTDYCNLPKIAHLQSSGTASTVLLIIVGLLITVTGTAFWSHGVAYMDENDYDSSTYHGVLICMKVLIYSLGFKFNKHTSDYSMWVQMLTLNIGYIINLPRLLRASKEIERVSFEDQGFFTSLTRVVTNKLAMSQMVCMSLTVAGFWGCAYYLYDIMKTKFLHVEADDFATTFSTWIYYHLIYVPVFLVGLKNKKPIMETFDKYLAIKKTTVMAVILFGLYIGSSFVTCEKGPVAGLSVNKFDMPLCSNNCGCSPHLEIKPTCVLDEMVTYLSPCHAGCTGMENLHGIYVVSNCTCSGGGRGARGVQRPCAACGSAKELYFALWILVVILVTVSLVLQQLTILRSVDARDRGAALGVACSLVCLTALVAGNAAYATLSYYTCSWSDNGVCKLHNYKFPYITHFISAGLTFLSALISFITFLLHRKSSDKRRQEVTPVGTLTVILE